MALNPYEFGHIIPWYAQFLDANGDPLSNGHIEIFKNGTSERYISYQNFDGSENPFKIPLNAGGRCVAIGSVRYRYDVYVYNRFGGLEFSRLNVGIGDSDAVNLEFTSHDGSIIITRNNNVVDLVVRQDPSTHGTVTADGTDEYGQIQFDTVVDGDVTVSAGKIVLDAEQLYHITLDMAFSTSVVGRDYYECMIEDSNGGQHKFIVDESMTTQFQELSWDITPEHGWIELTATLPEGVSLVGCTIYLHRVNPLVGGSGGGGGMTEVVTDSTLTGDGTVAAPLGIATSILQNIGSKLSSVSVDGTTITGDGTPENPLVATAATQEQANWAQTNTQAVDYIKNKPQNLVQDASYVHTDNNFTNADKSKLDGIESGAEVNDVEDVRVNGTSVVSNKIADVTVPTKTSDLTNDSGFITASEIPAQVQSDWTEADSSDPSYIKNKPNLATVATSGSYNDLTDKPSIPAIPVQDVEVNGSSVVNASGVAEVTVPTKTSDLDNDSGFITASQVPAQEQSDWNQSNSSAVDYIKNKPQNLVQDASYVHTDNNFTTTLKDKLDGIEAGAEVNVQSDWNQSDNTADDYIKNKPQNLVQDASYVHTDNNFTTTLKDKLDGIAAGAEVNVQSDWNQSDSNADDYIKNKPTINNVPVVTSSDDGKVLKASYSGGVGSYEWANESGGGTVTDVLVDGSSVVNAQGQAIIAMPTDLVPTVTSSDDGKILTATYSGGQASYAWTAPQTFSQQQSNWTQSDSSAVDYIKNKPSLIPLIAGSNITITESGGALTISSTGGGSGTITDVTVDGASVVNAQGVAAITMPTVPTKTSDLTNDSGFITASQIPAQVNSDWNASSGVAQILNKPTLATVATSGSYNDLSNKPSIPAAQVNSDWSASTGVAQILNKPDLSVYALSASLATVATSGSYNDLSNKPSIPAAQVNSDWNASSGVAQILNKPSIPTIGTITL